MEESARERFRLSEASAAGSHGPRSDSLEASGSTESAPQSTKPEHVSRERRRGRGAVTALEVVFRHADGPVGVALTLHAGRARIAGISAE